MNANMDDNDAGKRQSAAQIVHALTSFLRVVRYRKSIVIASVAATSLLGGLYFATATRYYRSSASLMVMQTGSEVTKADMSGEVGRTGGLMPTYERLIGSAAVLDRAAQSLGREFQADFKGIERHKWGEAIRRNLGISTARRTSIIDVSYASRDPKTAEAVVRAVVHSYLDFMERTHQGTAKEINRVFTIEKSQIEAKLAAKEDLLRAAMRKYNHIDLKNSQDHPPEITRALRLNEAMVAAQQQRLELQSMLNAVESAVSRGDDLQQFVLAMEGTVGRTYLMAYLGIGGDDAGSRAALERQLLTDRAERRTILEFYGRNHPLALEIDDRIRLTEGYLATYNDRVRSQLDAIRDNELGPLMVRMVRQKLNETARREQALGESFQQAQTAAVAIADAKRELTDLERDVAELRHEKQMIVGRIADIDLSEQHGTIRATLIDEPETAAFPFYPRLPIVALFSLLFGVGLGLVVVYVTDVLDDRLRSPEELQSHVGLPILSMVRQLPSTDKEGIESLLTVAAPQSPECEAFRTLRTSLAFSGQPASQIVVTSAEPSDGKTTVLANLAVAYAQAGKRTLAIDADMRRPGLTALLGMKHKEGLGELLQSDDVEALAAELTESTSTAGLDVIPAGLRRANPAELLASPMLIKLLAWAQSRYDQILIDSPPTLAASDTSIICNLVDGALLVVQPAKNRRPSIVRAAKSLAALNATVLGVVVNRIGGDANGYYGYSQHDYGYGYGSDTSSERLPDKKEAEKRKLVVPRRAA